MDQSSSTEVHAPRRASTTCSIPSATNLNWSNTLLRRSKHRRPSKSIGLSAETEKLIMRNIAIVGSGQAGLLAAHGLINAGYKVTLYSDRTAEQWLNESRPTGTAARFDISLAYERELGLNHWEKDAPVISYLLMRSTTERFADGTLYAFCSTT